MSEGINIHRMNYGVGRHRSDEVFSLTSAYNFVKDLDALPQELLVMSVYYKALAECGIQLHHIL